MELVKLLNRFSDEDEEIDEELETHFLGPLPSFF
jgi:hypothetical protein